MNSASQGLNYWPMRFCLLTLALIGSFVVSATAALPRDYFPLLVAGADRVAQRLDAEPNADLATLESTAGWKHFPSAILVASVLYTQPHPANPRRGDANHLSLWASTVYLGGKVFAKLEWEQLGARVLHRFATEEQAPDGYWGEHSRNGPTTGYDYLTATAVALYYEHSRDAAALEALRRSTDFHKFFTYPDGTPVETINDRNRYWGVSPWGHFGFSHFADGRRYAQFLTSFFTTTDLSLETLGRLAQNALYFHNGSSTAIPQDQARYHHQLSVPAGIPK